LFGEEGAKVTEAYPDEKEYDGPDEPKEFSPFFQDGKNILPFRMSIHVTLHCSFQRLFLKISKRPWKQIC
jgi:hypothetical protein